MTVLRLGVAGCGDVARYTAYFSRLNRGIQLVSCCDTRMERAQAFARQFRILRAFDDYEAMLDAGRLDAVYLAVPHHLHLPMIAAAVGRGLHVLVEKPLAGSAEDGLAAARLVEALGGFGNPQPPRVAVNYQYRYDSACYAMARAAQRGDLGELRYARINIPWKRGEEYFRVSAWHGIRAQAGGGTLLTQGSHFLDVALWACGQPVRSALGHTARMVFKESEVEDLAMGVLELESGAAVEICSSMIAPREGSPTIEIYGSRGAAFYRGGALPRLRFEGDRAGRIRRERPPAPGLHAMQRSVEGFRRWTAGGVEHLVPAREALAVLRAVEAIYRSAERGERVFMEEFTDGGL